MTCTSSDDVIRFNAIAMTKLPSVLSMSDGADRALAQARTPSRLFTLNYWHCRRCARPACGFIFELRFTDQRLFFRPIAFFSRTTTFLMLRSATSSFLRIASRPSASLLPLRNKSTGQFGVLSGAPKDELERKVFIYRPAKSAGQHASAAVPSYPWKLSFEKKDRWVNPLMGWTSSSDSLAGQTPGNMNFESKDAAIAFAEKNGEMSIFHCTGNHCGRILLISQNFRVENNFGGA